METAVLSIFVWIQVFPSENCHGNSCSHLVQSTGRDAGLCGNLCSLNNVHLYTTVDFSH